MNKKQLISLWIGLGVAILMVLYPPVESRYGLSFEFVWDLGSGSVVTGFLCLQLVVLTAVTAGAIYTLKDKRP